MTELNAIDIAAPILVPAPEVETPSPAVPVVEEKQITMSQSALDALIKARQSSSLKKAAAAEAEVARLRAITIGTAPDSSEVEKLRAQVADSQLMAAAAEARAIAQSKEILQARLAAQIDAVDASSVSKLLRDNLSWNATEKRFDVLTDDGTLRTNADGSAMKPETLYSEFQGSHPWAIRGRVLSGAGSTSSVAPPPTTYDVAKLFGPNSDGRLINQISLTNKPLYQKLRAEAKARNLVV
jgi:hypothetical protein